MCSTWPRERNLFLNVSPLLSNPLSFPSIRSFVVFFLFSNFMAFKSCAFLSKARICISLSLLMFASPLELAFLYSFTLHPFRFFRRRFRTQFLPLLLLPPLPSPFLPNGEPFRLTIDGGALYVAVHALTEGQKSLSPPRAFPLASHIALGPAAALLPLVLNYHHHITRCTG